MRNPKAETRSSKAQMSPLEQRADFEHLNVGLEVYFGFRISDFGFLIP